MVLRVEPEGQTDRDLRHFLRGMEDQIPFATALALTRTAKDVQGSLRGHMRQVLDRPKAYTLRGVRIRPAQKRDPQAWIWFVDEAPKGTPPANYLGPQIVGGSRRHKRHEKALHRAGILPRGWFTVPGQDARLNKHGHITGGTYTKILSGLRASPDPMQSQSAGGKLANRYFVLRRGGRPVGVYERTGKRRIKSILHFIEKSPTYTPRIDMEGVPRKVIDRRGRRHFLDAIATAAQSSRRRSGRTTDPTRLRRLLRTAQSGIEHVFR